MNAPINNHEACACWSCAEPRAHENLCQCRACQIFPPAPEPLYPRHGHEVRDELSDSTDAEMDRMRGRIAELERELAALKGVR